MGLSDPTAVLDAITATVDETCACGCSIALAGAASAWFATPGCQQRWQAARADRPMPDGGRMAGILPGWESDAAGPGGGRPHHRPVPLSGGWVVSRTGRIDLSRVTIPDEVRARLAQVERDIAASAPNLPPGLTFAFDTTDLRRRVGGAFEALREGMTMYAEVIRAAAADIGRVVERLESAGVIRPATPADPRQATLEAVRARRNSGPAGRVRVPRRIDPHGGAPRR